MRVIEIPSIALEGSVTSAIDAAFWPYDDGTNDPYWLGGTTPRAYRWILSVDVSTQTHSSHLSRQSFTYNARDIKVGDYIADISSGLSLKIIRIDAQSDHTLVCLVEDTLRYNTFRDSSQSGIGIFNTPNSVLIFEVNDHGTPVLEYPVTSAFYASVMSKFDNLDETCNFQLRQPSHSFKVGDLIAADQNTNGFIKADNAHPYVIGTVSYVDLGPDDFMVNPLQKVIDSYNSLPGQISDILYVDNTNPGGYSTSGTIPVLIKLRDFSNSSTTSLNLSATSTPGFQVKVNNFICTLGGTGTGSDLANAINLVTANTGVTASEILAPTIASSISSNYVYGEPLITIGSTPVTATINGYLVTFSTASNGLSQYGAGYAVEEDMVIDINAAAIPNIVAYFQGNTLYVKNTSGGSITIVNGTGDINGNMFAGPNSISGLPLITSASTGTYVYLVAEDARAISLDDISGTILDDFGLISVENGAKAAALYIEQGIRQAATYVVASISARDALNAMFGDQAYVQDHGNGEWGFYIYTLDNTWVKLADQDSAQTDAQSVEVIITPSSPSSELIHTISNGRRVSFVTVTVTQPFNTPATISVGDSAQHDRLMTSDQNDLMSISDYSTTPAYTYASGSDTDINFYFNANGATQGSAVVAITYT